MIAVGSGLIAGALWTVRWVEAEPRWPVLCVLTLLGAVATIRMRAAPISFSISDTFTFTTLLLIGPAAATVNAALEALVLSCLLSRNQRRVTRILFNVSAVGSAMWLAGTVLDAFGPAGQGALAGHPLRLVVATAAAVSAYFLTNTWIVAIAVALEQGQTVSRAWRTHFLGLAFNYVAGAYLAVLLALFAPALDTFSFLLLAPLPLVLYAALRMWAGRTNDRVAHLDSMNQQRRATIEALAHAIDAKDQVTHGHIHRVQKNAMLIARELGITEEPLLRALEAAALLHDTGKLAIPEHILNKPDKLTPAEFDVMKLHTTIGADILSPIDFPYPVVPIVRHHHEHWDGTGYPDGLRGTDIPIGARIIAVVDCFDALTSDRPYRRALPADRALRIIVEARGVMYDPDIVDALVRIKDAIHEPPAATAGPLETIAQATQAVKQAGWTDQSIPASTVALAGRLGQLIARHEDLPALCEDIYKQLSLATPSLTIVIYQYDAQLDCVVGRTSAGIHRDLGVGLTIGMGLRLTGWVAAHRQTIVNSEAALDLGNAAAKLYPAPLLCLATPIVADGKLAGVLTAYSTVEPFATRDIAVFEMLAGLLGPVVAADAAARERTGVRGATSTAHAERVPAIRIAARR